jgi:hypothetical protein
MTVAGAEKPVMRAVVRPMRKAAEASWVRKRIVGGVWGVFTTVGWIVARDVFCFVMLQSVCFKIYSDSSKKAIEAVI